MPLLIATIATVGITTEKGRLLWYTVQHSVYAGWPNSSKLCEVSPFCRYVQTAAYPGHQQDPKLQRMAADKARRQVIQTLTKLSFTSSTQRTTLPSSSQGWWYQQPIATALQTVAGMPHKCFHPAVMTATCSCHRLALLQCMCRWTSSKRACGSDAGGEVTCQAA